MARQPKPPSRGTVIYGLVDPRDQQIYYVGKTNNPKTRVRYHLTDKVNKQRMDWIKELVRQKLEPLLVILERVKKGEPWQDREIEWIARGRELGWPLTNISNGGEEPPQSYANRSGRGPRR